MFIIFIINKYSLNKFYFIRKYYLVDARYPQMDGYLGPYKGERYHLPDFRRGSQPTGHKEVFNHAHSS